MVCLNSYKQFLRKSCYFSECYKKKVCVTFCSKYSISNGQIGNKAEGEKPPALCFAQPSVAVVPFSLHLSQFSFFCIFCDIIIKKINYKGKLHKATVMISHRIYSTRFCDKIAVFNKGEIAEYGSFTELMANKSLYFDFFEKQAKYFK